MSDSVSNILTLENIKILGIGALISLGIAIGAMSIGVVLGTIGAMCKLSKNKFLNYIGLVYVELMRGTPMLLQITFLFLGFPMLYKMITGIQIYPNALIAGLIAMGINSGAYQTELIRSGVQSISKGQWEASKSIGLNYRQTMQYVILPQVFKRILPPLVSEMIVLIKDSSLISAIGGLELMKRSKNMGAQYYNYLVPLLIATAFYLIMTMTLSYFARRLERRLHAND